MKNKTIWVVKGYELERTGKLVWKDLKTFTNPTDAEEWLYNQVRNEGRKMSELTIATRTA